MPRISSRLREVAAYKNRTGGDRWSLMGEGRLREVVANIGRVRLYCCFLSLESILLILVLQSGMVALTN